MGAGTFGLEVFIACALGPVKVGDATRVYMPYFLVLLIGALIVAFVPWFTLGLPRLMGLS